MTSGTERSVVGRVSSDGEFEIPEPLREAVGIDAPDEMLAVLRETDDE